MRKHYSITDNVLDKILSNVHNGKAPGNKLFVGF